jgi:FtsP/CotA-like multicopper oxidase with cupredoxin domain
VFRQHAPRIAAIAGAALLVGVLVVIAKAWYDSRLPGTYSVMDYGHADYGGGSVLAHAGHGGSELGLSVAALHGPRNEVPDRRFTLTAKTASVRLASGRVVDAMTFDGIAPGPELRANQGDLVEVTVSQISLLPITDFELAMGFDGSHIEANFPHALEMLVT